MASKGYFELLGMIHVYGIDDKRVQAKGKQLFKGKPGSKAKEYYVFDEQDNYIMTGTTKENLKWYMNKHVTHWND